MSRRQLGKTFQNEFSKPEDLAFLLATDAAIEGLKSSASFGRGFLQSTGLGNPNRMERATRSRDPLWPASLTRNVAFLYYPDKAPEDEVSQAFGSQIGNMRRGPGIHARLLGFIRGTASPSTGPVNLDG